MTKLYLSVKKINKYFTLFLGDKILKSKKGNSIKFKDEIIAKKVINELKSTYTYEELADNNLIKLLLFSEDHDSKCLLEYILNYLQTDTVLYRGDKGTDLEILQKRKWDPVINYVEQNHKVLQFKI